MAEETVRRELKEMVEAAAVVLILAKDQIGSS